MGRRSQDMLEMLKRSADLGVGSPVATCMQGCGRAVRGTTRIATTNDEALGLSPGQY